MEEVGLDVPAHLEDDRWVIDCEFPRAFDSEAKRWGEAVSWDDVIVRWKGRGPMNVDYVNRLQRGYRSAA
jgi:ring-1,2-phenylacetyl-CoA epoxidase subunit PaaA